LLRRRAVEDDFIDIVILHIEALRQLLTRSLKFGTLNDTAKIKKNGANGHGNYSVYKKSRRLKKCLRVNGG
jgi:hypothetical protein